MSEFELREISTKELQELKTASNTYEEIIQGFLNSGMQAAEIVADGGKTLLTRRAGFDMAIVKYHHPIRVYAINGKIYLERT